MSERMLDDFNQEMRRGLPASFRPLLDVATEIHVKHGLKNGAEATRRNGQGAEWERLRSCLMDLARAGYVAEEWRLEERF